MVTQCPKRGAPTGEQPRRINAGKKTQSSIITVAFIFGLLVTGFPLYVLAAVNDLRIEQVQAELPQLCVYFHLNIGEEPMANEVTASLGSTGLSLQELRRYNPETDPTSYFFIVDCSTSTTAAQIEAVKVALRQFATEMDGNTPVTLIAFGTSVQVLLQRETDGAAVMAAAETLAADQPGTLFFDGLAKAIDLASNKDYALERKIAFVFSDSVDYNLGGYTREEVDKLLAASSLPFYALGFDTGTKQELDNFGALARTSGGDIAIVSADTLPQALQQMVAAVQDAWIARFDAGSNIVETSAQEFTLELVEQGLTASRPVVTRHWQADNTAPLILSVEQQTGGSILLQFSEPVDGATSPESFSVANEAGDLLGIQASTYNEEDHSARITFSAPPVTGSYILSCPGITDRSMEKNKVAETVSFQFSGNEEVLTAEQQPVPVGAWIAVSLVGLGVIAAVMVALTRKNPKEAITASAGTGDAPAAAGGQKQLVYQPLSQGGEVQVHFSQVPVALPKIKLQVTGSSGMAKAVEVAVHKTLFVGRSDICDVFFDDASMSRQHFVIAEENGLYTITDLGSSGGTQLNGVKLQNTRPLQSGDTIRAGGQTIVFFSPRINGEG